MELKDYDLVIINSSAGKDSLAALWEMVRLANEQNYPRNKMVVSHQDLGEMEWGGTKELAEQQAKLFGLDFHVSKQRNKEGKNETLLEYVENRGKWPSSQARYCTSDFKRGPGARVVTMLTKGMPKSKVLYVFGFRKDESPARAKKKVFEVNKRLSTKTRTVHNYLPIHTWSIFEVWAVIKENYLPYHPAYDLGMPRLSCRFCIFAPYDALLLAGYANPELLDQYVEVEKKIGHTFTQAFSLVEVKEAMERGDIPEAVQDWTM